MAYKGFISHGTDYVGELKSLRRRLLAQNRQKIARHYDSEDELIAESDYIDRLKYTEDILKARRMGYILYWGSEKGLEKTEHSRKLCWSPCEQCGFCQCGQVLFGHRFSCMCSEGKKMLSPYRILFINTSVRADWMYRIYQVGHGPVPREHFRTPPPDWKTVTW